MLLFDPVLRALFLTSNAGVFGRGGQARVLVGAREKENVR
jgi:hypothetical protein